MPLNMNGKKSLPILQVAILFSYCENFSRISGYNSNYQVAILNCSQCGEIGEVSGKEVLRPPNLPLFGFICFHYTLHTLHACMHICTSCMCEWKKLKWNLISISYYTMRPSAWFWKLLVPQTKVSGTWQENVRCLHSLIRFIKRD